MKWKVEARYIPLLIVIGYFLVLISIRSYVSVMTYLAFHYPSLGEVHIDQAALKDIDFDKLEPEVAKFIRLSQEGQVIGRPVSDFSNLWQFASKYEEGSSSGEVKHPRSYHFFVPSTEESKVKYKTGSVDYYGVVCWPMLGVKLTQNLTTIRDVYVYYQCF
jgi:hypothetical protein